ncbi:hypothetical protein CDL15_Pgr004635 [Punica granatum]|uniref:Uncharacterized protein n=1 Tax=Punica granatum TaxID=22663 RepID=A0A218WQW8_PUNGR|nr:hypothetical protein CDL15_Pgr004635 [Punica granatum]
MVREEDPFWGKQYVEILRKDSNRNRRWKCKFCGQEFTGKVTRVKEHLGHVSGGITQCPNVDESTKEAAKTALQKHKAGNRTSTDVNDESSNPSGQHIPETGKNPSKRSIREREKNNQFKRCRPVEANTMPATESDGTDLDMLAPVIGQASHIPGALQGQLETLEIKLYNAECRVRSMWGEVERIKNEVQRIRQEGPVSSEGCSFKLQTHVEKLTTEVDDLLASSGPSPFQEQRENGKAFLLSTPVGAEFKKNITRAWNFLRRDDISQIGIYGMAGVGKTRLAMHLYNRVCKDESFENVLWVPSPKENSIYALQAEIAKALKVPELLKAKTDEERPKVLREYLSKRRKSVLFLDDVWVHFKLEEAGIPIRRGCLKLVLTTRSSRICREMLCQEVIKIEALCPYGAINLFYELLEFELLTSEVELIAKGIRDKCGGLPLAIRVMAESLRGSERVHEWEEALRQLKDVGHNDINTKVFPILKHSYDCLPQQMQWCLLRCASYAKALVGDAICELDLVELFIDEGLIDGPCNMLMKYQESRSIVEGLIDVCLLERYYKKVRIHSMIQDMAFNIMSTSSPAKVNSGMRSEDTMDEEEHWTSGVDLVYLPEIKGVVQNNMPPNRRELASILLIKEYSWLDNIPEPFFMHLVPLKVLNLSESRVVELPGSISGLIHLRALVLRNCSNLSRIPSIAKMKSLTKLDLSLCAALEAVPDGLENLAQLEYLDIYGTNIYGLCEGLLNSLVNIQFLGFNHVDVQEKEVSLSALTRLECLRCSFSDAYEVRMFATSNPRLPSWFDLVIGCNGNYRLFDDDWFEMRSNDIFQCGKVIRIHGGWYYDEVRGGISLPEDVQSLCIRDNGGGEFAMSNFYDWLWDLAGDIRLDFYPTEVNRGIHLLTVEGVQENMASHISHRRSHLKELIVYRCQKLRYLFTVRAGVYLENLRVLKIEYCGNLKGLIAPESPDPIDAFRSLESIYVKACLGMTTLVGSLLSLRLQKLRKIVAVDCFSMEEIIEWSPSHQVDLSSLKEIHVSNCCSIERLLAAESLPLLQDLETIDAIDCKCMKEVIGHAQGQSSQNSSRPRLRQLKSLSLSSLPELTSICDQPLICGSIEEIAARGCPKLKRIPLDLPPGPDGRPSPPSDLKIIYVQSKERWESLEWPDQPEAKTLLQPFVRYDQ